MFELFEEVNHLVSLCVSRIFGGVFDLCILLYKRTTNLNSRTDFSLFESCAKRTFCGIAREVDKRISPVKYSGIYTCAGPYEPMPEVVRIILGIVLVKTSPRLTLSTKVRFFGRKFFISSLMSSPSFK